MLLILKEQLYTLISLEFAKLCTVLYEVFFFNETSFSKCIKWVVGDGGGGNEEWMYFEEKEKVEFMKIKIII
jgi:hypothetical protein